MNTAILYFSKHGTTEKVANLIAERLGKNQTEVIDLKKVKNPDIQSFDRIILGCGIYAGKPSKSFQDFCTRNLTTFLSKKIGLFVCGMEISVEKQQQELLNAYHTDLLQHATAKSFLGGEFNFEKMNFAERLIIKRIANINKNVSAIKKAEITSFVNLIKKS